jgi:tRNA 2-thiouridine synthesizing protein E
MHVARDDEGYLVEPDDWNAGLAAELASEEGIALGEAHWQVVDCVRRHYAEHRVAPDVRHVVDCLGEQGIERKAAKALIFTLFPYGYVKQACKIAGMKRPRAWSTG